MNYILLPLYRSAQVAVKQLAITNNQALLKEFEGEVLLMEQLKPHPNVVYFFGACINPEKPLCLITYPLLLLLLLLLLFQASMSIYIVMHLDFP